MIKTLRYICFEILLYASNYCVAFIPSHVMRIFFYRNAMKLKLGKDSYIFMGAHFDTRSNFVMDRNSVINQSCRLDNRGGIVIGKNVSISAEVCILTADHDPQSPTFQGRSKPVTIQDYVFVGTRAMLLPGVTLHRGCVVCAGAVVTTDVAENTIVAGVPARVIGNREIDFSYTINYGRLLH